MSSAISTSRPSGDMPLKTMPCFGERLAILVIQLIAVAMAVIDQRLVIGRGRFRARHQEAGIKTQAHGAALVGCLTLVGHQVDDRVGRLGIELG